MGRNWHRSNSAVGISIRTRNSFRSLVGTHLHGWETTCHQFGQVQGPLSCVICHVLDPHPGVITLLLAGAEALGEALSSNSCLQRLDLSNNGIKAAGPSGASSLSSLLRACRRRSLQFSGSTRGSGAQQQLWSGLGTVRLRERFVFFVCV